MFRRDMEMLTSKGPPEYFQRDDDEDYHWDDDWNYDWGKVAESGKACVLNDKYDAKNLRKKV